MNDVPPSFGDVELGRARWVVGDNNSWARNAQRVIMRVEREARDAHMTRKQFEKALYDAYPFGERRMWPYKAWLRQRRLALDRWDRAHGEASE